MEEKMPGFLRFILFFHFRLVTAHKCQTGRVKILRIYREVQVMLQEFNRIYRGKLFFLHTIGSVSLVASMYSLVVYFKGAIDMPFIMLALHPLLVVDGIVVLHVVFGFAGDFHTMSAKVHEKLRSCHFLMLSKLFRQFHYSCSALKVMFGGSNFVEKMTSLIFIHFCFCRLLDLLLIR